MKLYLLSETNYKAIKDQKFELAILPWGATEAHNYHLPYGTDVYEADHIAAESARIAWEWGREDHRAAHSSLRRQQRADRHPARPQRAPQHPTCRTERHRGSPRSPGNSQTGRAEQPRRQRLQAHPAELGVRYPEMHLSFCFWFNILDRKDYFEEKGDHADELETSVMLHLRPDLVLPLEEAGDGAAKQHTVAAFREGWAWSERKWSQVTADTGIGDPRKATAAKGKPFFKDLTEKLGAFSMNWRRRRGCMSRGGFAN